MAALAALLGEHAGRLRLEALDQEALLGLLGSRLGNLVEDLDVAGDEVGLEPLAAEFFGGERVWTYSLEFNDTDGRILALEYYELGVCATSGMQPEVSLEEGRRDLALTYAPFESGLLGRAVTLDEVLSGAAGAYQRELDERLGLIVAATTR